MNDQKSECLVPVDDSPASWLSRDAPIVALVFMSPILAEIHFGAIRFTVLFALLPATGAWGCGALIIREFARKNKLGWISIALMGLSLSLAEECIIQQTSFAPLVGMDPDQIYGRAMGVNWTYLLWAIVYETIWAVIIPIQIVELMFPGRRYQVWLKRRGFIIATCVFVVSSLFAWFLWTQIMIPKLFPESIYSVPSTHFAVALVLIFGLTILAFFLPREGDWPISVRRLVPHPMLLGIIGACGGSIWFLLVFLAYGMAMELPTFIPMTVGLLLAGITFSVIIKWSSSDSWSDVHGLSLSFGALLASMLMGYMILIGGRAPVIDYVFKFAVNIAVVIFVYRLIVKTKRA